MTDYTNILYVGIALLLEIFIGFICIKFKFVPKEYIPPINNFDFKVVFLPLMARSFAIRDLYTMNFMPLAACALMSLSTQIILAILCFIIPFQDKFAQYIALLLPIVYVNYVIIGIPLFDAIWGSEHNEITSVIIMSNDMLIVPIYQIVTAIYKLRKTNIERRANGQPEEKFTIKALLLIFLNIFKSPIMQGIIVGIIWSLTTIKLPVYLDRLMLTIANTITACALFCVGGFLAQHSLIACKWYEFILGLFFRFIVMPLLGCLFSDALGLSNSEIRQVTVLACVSSAFATYSISVNSGIGTGIASTMIFWTTILCIPFVILWLWVFDSLDLFLES